MKILVANRGEIARRIIATVRAMGHSPVAVYADPDAGAPHVVDADEAYCIGPAELAASYLNIDAIMSVIEESGSSAVHPGYGFLAENADFARTVSEAGVIWIGPHPEALASMGSKIEARRLATAAGVPVVPGYDETTDTAKLAAAAERIGYPVLVKASAGGGGRGIRVVNKAAEFASQLAEASSEAERAFGDGSMIVERFITQPRHIEVQLIGDRHGRLIHLGTRECSLQRRYQKVIEEAPAPNLSEALRSDIEAAAVKLGSAIGYDSAGTVEFIVDAQSEEYFFLEMNTRLQVEHPVTEQVTGVDLVALMIQSAMDRPLALTQSEVRITGHSFEARLNAENPWAGFVPQTGEVSEISVPKGIRWDSAVVGGSEITPHYDSMIAKLITTGADRAEALTRLARALDQLVVGGVPTNAGFLSWLIGQPSVVEGRMTTRFIDSLGPLTPPDVELAAQIAADAFLQAGAAKRHTGAVWERIGPLRLATHRSSKTIQLDRGDESYEVVEQESSFVERPTVVDLDKRRVAVNLKGETFAFSVPTVEQRWAPTGVGANEGGLTLASPFPALVTEVLVVPGQAVNRGDVLVVIEAMKMLHSLSAKGDGIVEEVRAAPGDQVASDTVLVTFTDTSEDS